MSARQPASVKTAPNRPGAFVEDERGLDAEVDWLQSTDNRLFRELRDVMNKIHIAYIATYPPRECGIGTFTRDLSSAIVKFMPFSRRIIVAMSHGNEIEQYPRDVRFQIFDRSRDSHTAGADFVNDSVASVVSLQHEFGIFGGPDGEYVLDFAERLQKPLVVTLHTVLQNPSPNQKRIIQRLSEIAKSMVVMVNMGGDILKEVYGVPDEKITLIPHGVPNVHRVNPKLVKRDLGIDGHEVMSTFGLISRGKGIQYAIEAVAEVKKKFPNILYLVLGETHPEIRNQEGESYRQTLQDLMDKLDLHSNVKFNNRFLSLRELVRYLSATDVYVTPYINKDQIVSGTLAYALGCGRAIVSTNYLYAQEVLSEGRGILVDTCDPDAMAKGVIEVLSNPELRESLEANAYTYGRRAAWFNVAVDYLSLFHSIVDAQPAPASTAG